MADRTVCSCLFLLIIAIPFVLSTGCIVMPAPRSSESGSPDGSSPPGMMQKSSNITGIPLYYGWRDVAAAAMQSEPDRISVVYRGGRDDAFIDSIKIDIKNSYDQSVTRTVKNPQIGQKFTFDAIGTSRPDTVMVTAYFQDNTTQTVLVTQV
jgi:hypothetical protein